MLYSYGIPPQNGSEDMNDLRERFHNIDDYILYYGCGGEQELSVWNMAVVEPSGHDRDGIMKLKQNGTIVIAYLSVMEIHPSDPDFAVINDNLMKYGSELIKNDVFGTYLVDMGSCIWNEFLIHKALKLCLKDGYDGVFLDTIGDVETSLVPAALRRFQLIHAVNFVKTLRDRLPDKILVQNNGIEELYMYTSDYIDGCCWEGPDFFDSSRKQYNACILKALESMNAEGLRILMLTQNIRNEEQIEYIRRLSKDRGFIYYNASCGYTNI